MTSHTGSGDPHARLNELREATIRRAAGLVGSFDDIVEAASDVATDDEHDPEGHTIAWERQQIAALLDETRTTLADIEAAEHHLDDGTEVQACGPTVTGPRVRVGVASRISPMRSTWRSRAAALSEAQSATN